jgi:hypothetical protein
VVFHGGRLSMELPAAEAMPPEQTENDEQRTSKIRRASPQMVAFVNVIEYRIDDPVYQVDPGMLAFALVSQTADTTEVGRQQVELPALGVSATHVRVEKDGKRRHVSVFAADPYTFMMVGALERQPVAMEDFAAILRTVQVERAREPGRAPEP